MTLIEIARIVARHNTVVARAMRDALMELGIDADAVRAAERRYDGVVECMRNVVSPTDRKEARRA